MFGNKMETEAIPERVYALCKVVEKEAVQDSKVKERMEPSYLNQKSSYYSIYRNAAIELQLIVQIDNILSLAVDPSIVKDIDSMGYYINGQLNQFQEGYFYKVTKAYFALGESILHGEQNVANMTMVKEKTGLQLKADDMRAWRFWASYLGFGYMQDMFLIPNADVFLWDVICRAEFNKNQMYSITEFIDKIRPYANIIINPVDENRTFNYGVSNGLRTLQNTGYIKIEYGKDQANTWNLYRIEDLDLTGNEAITNITILK